MDEEYFKKVYNDPDCKSCQRALAEKDYMTPRHDASANCQSGKRNHCTCDTCY